jgi:Ca2+-dependent lipid-binding protein
MHIELLQAVGLKAADSNGQSDPYVVLCFLGKKHKSKVVPKTLNPQWNQSFEFNGTLRELTTETCVLEVFDKDRFTRDESLGKQTIDLTCMRSHHEQHLEIALPTQGRVFVRVIWTPK